MSALTQLLPTPSDRMGTIWGLLAIKDACILEYGPAGTTHFGLGPISSLELEARGRYFVTHLDEKDVIMGNVERLEKAVLEIDTQNKPQYIFIIASSVTATIGTDLVGISRALQDRCNAKLEVFESGGFAGNYLVGFEMVYERLVHLLNEIEIEAVQQNPATDRPLRYHILGGSPDHYRWRSDVLEIERVFDEALSAEVAQTFLIDSALSELGEIAKADFCLLLREEARPLAKYLQERFEIPYFEANFYGYEGSLEVVEAVAQYFGRQICDKFSDEIKAHQAEIAYFPFYARQLSQPLRFFSIADRDHNQGLAQAISELGFEFEAQLDITAPEPERLAALARMDDALVFADSESLSRLPETAQGILISFPWYDKSFYARHLPFMGPRGMDQLAEIVHDHLMKRP
ncbi:MAG: nitrogenase component 1 [Eubacteriales bacterium]|nr:nitrogenase component 1 [Eubacteriales bacterium]